MVDVKCPANHGEPLMSKILTAALLGAFTLSFAVAPITFNTASNTIGLASAFAKHGADDPVPPQEPQPDDDHGGL